MLRYFGFLVVYLLFFILAMVTAMPSLGAFIDSLPAFIFPA